MSPVNVVAVDIGGTFTDLVVQRPLRVRQVLKLPTTTDRPEIAVLRAVRALGLTGTSEVVHATTLATNSLLTPTERLLRSVGLLTTEGFRDVLEIGRQNRPSLYDLNFSRPRPLVASENRREVSERTNAAGTIVRPAHEPELRSTSAKLKRNGVRSLAISFLHSYKNPTNERRAAATARRLFPHVSASSEIAPEPREFERTSTVVVNAVLMPVVSDYLSRLQEGLASLGVRQVSVMASSGGLVDPREAAARPVQIVESGPAAGVVAAAALGVDAVRPP